MIVFAIETYRCVFFEISLLFFLYTNGDLWKEMTIVCIMHIFQELSICTRIKGLENKKQENNDKNLKALEFKDKKVKTLEFKDKN